MAVDSDHAQEGPERVTTYRIEARGEVREVYIVEAASEQEARDRFEAGDIPTPVVSEAATTVESIEVES